ncbi:MAG: hypothetical protein U9N52_13795 [Campylobacterota bacterium]|nr:hypothetical protein [Campylobacterota bacterium]
MSEENNEIEMYDFEIFGLIKEAFNRSDGVKWFFIASIFAYGVVAFIVNVILGFIFGAEGAIADNAKSLLSMPVLVPIMLGIVMLAIKHVRGKALELQSIFDYFVIVWPLVFATVAMYIMMAIGFLLLILPGIYLAVAYKFTLPLMADKNLGIWEAMERSRRTVHKRWFKFFGLDISLFIIVIISAIPFGIGLIWTIPLAFITHALLYHHLFDDDEGVIEEAN